MAPKKCKSCEHYDFHVADKDHVKGEWCYMFVNPVKNCTKFSLAQKVIEQVEWMNEELNKYAELNSKLGVACGVKAKALSDFAGYVRTCRTVNTPDWMEGLADALNVVADVLQCPLVFEFDGNSIRGVGVGDEL